MKHLVFGCGHLVGGAGQSQADSLVTRCLDAGIQWFDTAPVYGLGTAESALATALRRDGRRAFASVKVGLERPGCGMLWSYVRAAKRSILRPAGRRDRPSPPLSESDPRLPRGRFDLDRLARSFYETRLKLGQHVDVGALFLHEAYADNLKGDAIELLYDWKDKGHVQQLGLANGCVYSPAIQALVPPDFMIQSAVPPGLFGRPDHRLNEKHVLHTVIQSFLWRYSVDATFRLAVLRTRERFAEVLGRGKGADVLLAYLLLEEAAPHSRLIYATGEILRLEAFLTGMTNVTRAGESTAIVDFFAQTSASNRI